MCWLQVWWLCCTKRAACYIVQRLVCKEKGKEREAAWDEFATPLTAENNRGDAFSLLLFRLLIEKIMFFYNIFTFRELLYKIIMYSSFAGYGNAQQQSPRRASRAQGGKPLLWPYLRKMNDVYDKQKTRTEWYHLRISMLTGWTAWSVPWSAPSTL